MGSPQPSEVFSPYNDLVSNPLVSRPWVFKSIGTVPFVGTGSPLTVMYLLYDFFIVSTLWRAARSSAIRVAADPVSGKVRN